jgi:predicted ATPase/DNA-binding XRE family transcriptional regulator
MTQEELAERAGLTAKAVGALERGDRRHPYPHTVRALSRALGLSPADAADLAASVPPRSAQGPRPNPPSAAPFPTLPAPLVGRDEDIAAVMDAVMGESRLLTLTGPGGVGKTSLAIEVGHRLKDKLPDGVTFVPLAQVGEPGMVLDSIAHALGLRDVAGKSLREVISVALQHRQGLLVLDNFEHLLPAAGEVAELMSACPTIRMLVTSRSPLRIRSEREFVVAPLAVPDHTHPLDSPSVQLFVRRASAVTPSFQMDDSNAHAVAAICRRLEGLPLAIELAAARIRVLSPETLLLRLDSILPVLTGGSRDLPDRQRTLRESIRWSYDLLDEIERGLFRRLAVFAGGWSLEGAEAVAPAHDVLDPLERLVEASLVVRMRREDRYRMLEPIREYAMGELDAAGELAETRDRHAAFYLDLAENACRDLTRGDQLARLQVIDRHHDNLRSALSWLLTRPDDDGSAALRLAATLAPYWFLRGHWSEGRGWLARALDAHGGACTEEAASALEGAGLIAQFQNDYHQAATWLQRAVAIYRQGDNREGEASALSKWGFVAAFQNDRAKVEELCGALTPLEAHLRDPATIGNVLIFRGLEAVLRDDLPEAERLHERALALYRQVSDVQGIVWCLTNLGLLKIVTGELATASEMLREHLGMAARLREPASVQYALLGLATVATQQAQPMRAARLWGAAEAIRQAAGMELSFLARTQTMYDTWVERAREAAGDDDFDASWAEGTGMSLEETVSYALSTTPEAVAGAR